MASTIRQILLQNLEDLSKKDLQKFRARLLDREGEPRIRRRALEDQDELGVVDVLVSTFTEAGAGGVAVEILKAIDRNVARTLETNLEALKLRAGESSAARSSSLERLVSISSPTEKPEKHFVDQHRSALIQRIRSVAPILDRLLDRKVVTQEQYSRILAINNPPDRIRELYDGPLMSSGTKGKDIFLKVLEEIEPFMMEDLRGQ